MAASPNSNSSALLSVQTAIQRMHARNGAYVFAVTGAELDALINELNHGDRPSVLNPLFRELCTTADA